MLLVWALSMICLVKLVRIMSGWFLERFEMFRMAVVRVDVFDHPNFKTIGFFPLKVFLQKNTINLFLGFIICLIISIGFSLLT